MPRKGRADKRRTLPPDPVFGDPKINRFINIIMRDGKKSVAERICYGMLDMLKQKTKSDEGNRVDAITILNQALENVKPVIEVKSRRVGGSTYQVPVEVRPERRESLGMRWLLAAAQERKEHSMMEKLAGEVLEAYQKRGGAVKKKEDVHRMAEANKAFAHYRW